MLRRYTLVVTVRGEQLPATREFLLDSISASQLEEEYDGYVHGPLPVWSLGTRHGPPCAPPFVASAGAPDASCTSLILVMMSLSTGTSG